VAQWFRRFGDIDGLAYTTPEHIDRSSLAGHDEVPEVDAWHSDNRRGTLRGCSLTAAALPPLLPIGVPSHHC
jgi:hypothetical protein